MKCFRIQSRNDELEISLQTLEVAKRDVETKLNEAIILKVDLEAKVHTIFCLRDEGCRRREGGGKFARLKGVSLIMGSFT